MRALALVLLLGACVLGKSEAWKPPVKDNPLTGGEVTTQKLDAADKDPAAKPDLAKPGTTKPEVPAVAEAKAAPETVPPEAAPAPAVVLSPEALACVKTGGQWATAGESGAKACVHFTKDRGKQCTKASQCEGYCLSRSGTCAPVTPLFGCNDIFQDDGSQATLCIE